MTKKELETRLNNLEFVVKGLQILQSTCADSREYLSIEHAKQRDYIVRTKYLGKIILKQLKDDFKKEVEEKLGDKFDCITNKLLNYEFFYEKTNLLEGFSKILQKYEYKQLIIDTYGDK